MRNKTKARTENITEVVSNVEFEKRRKTPTHFCVFSKFDCGSDWSDFINSQHINKSSPD